MGGGGSRGELLVRYALVTLSFCFHYPIEKQITQVASGAVVHLPGDRARRRLDERGGRRPGAALLLPPPRQNYGFDFHGLLAQVLCPLSSEEGDVVSSTSMPRRQFLHSASCAFAGTRCSKRTTAVPELLYDAIRCINRNTAVPDGTTAEPSCCQPHHCICANGSSERCRR